ncbi:MAG: Ig domain-containing protein [Gaiellaceae bacterium]
MKLAVVVMGIWAAVAVTGASAADFEGDNGACRETPGEALLLRCPTGYVGVPYEIVIESEEGSGCEPYDWFEVVNGALPAGLAMTRDGVISGVPTSSGLVRFWLWNHDLTAAQGGPSWCEREDRSEREFSIPIDPGLAIINSSLKPATSGQPYTETLVAKQVVSLNPLTGSDVQATWSLQSGALPPGITLSTSGVLSGTPASEGSYAFVVKAQNVSPVDTETYTLTVRQPVVVKSPFAPVQRPTAEVGIRFGKTVTATGGSGTYTWSLSSGALPSGLALNASKGTLSGTPQAAGNFAFGLSATDAEGRVATVNAFLTVAPRLAIKTLRLTDAKLRRPYRAALVTVGGVAPLKWRVVRGKLPSGVRLSQKLGTLAGTPRRIGTYRVLVEARDALGARSQRTLVLLVEK